MRFILGAALVAALFITVSASAAHADTSITTSTAVCGVHLVCVPSTPAEQALRGRGDNPVAPFQPSDPACCVAGHDYTTGPAPGSVAAGRGSR